MSVCVCVCMCVYTYLYGRARKENITRVDESIDVCSRYRKFFFFFFYVLSSDVIKEENASYIDPFDGFIIMNPENYSFFTDSNFRSEIPFRLASRI